MPTPYTTLRQRYYVKQRRTGGEGRASYEAKDLLTRADLVLQYTAWSGEDDPRRASFEGVACALRAAHHPALPVVLDSFADADGGYLVLEQERGIALGAGPHADVELRRWAAQLLDALDYLHTLTPPVAHGAVTPQNLVLRPGDQIALRAYGAAALDAGGDVNGDLRQLAATLYTLATGALPPTDAARQEAIARGDPDPLSASGPLGALIAAGLELDPDRQPASAAAMLALLEPLPGPGAAPPAESAREPNEPAPRRPPARRWWPVVALVDIAALALALVLSGALRTSPPGIAQATPSPAPITTVPATAAPATAAPSAEPTGVASATPPPTAQPTTAPQPTAVPVSVTGVEPAAVFARRPFTITLSGANLGAVQSAQLAAPDGRQVPLAIEAASAEQLTLRSDALEELPAGDAPFRIVLDGVALDAPTVLLRDYIVRVSASGILAEYLETGRVRRVAGELTASLLSEPRAGSGEIGVLHPGDAVDILGDDPPGWYEVRLPAGPDAATDGATGWAERWLIDGPSAAGAPTPAPFVFAGQLGQTPTDDAVQCGTSFESSVYGSVESNTGKGLAGARVRVTSADGRSRFDVTTRGDGTYEVPGLGCTTWIVRLVSIPERRGVQANDVTVTNLNGGKLSAAEVRFRLQR